jgi:hypothetical protein
MAVGKPTVNHISRPKSGGKHAMSKLRLEYQYERRIQNEMLSSSVQGLLQKAPKDV